MTHINRVNGLPLPATGVGEVDADRCVRLWNDVIRSSDTFLPP